MTWFKVDDGFYSSKKVLSIPRSQRLAAVGLWTMAGNWSGRELSDGVVPEYVLDELGATPKLREALIKARLWLDHPEGGIEFRNWVEYQPTREQVEEERRKTKERQRRHRERQRDDSVTNADVTRDSPVSNDAPTRPDPTRPDQDETSAGKRTPIPSDWEPTAEHVAKARELKVGLELEAERFKAHAEANDRRVVRWNAAFTQWLLKAEPIKSAGSGNDWMTSRATDWSKR